MEETSFVDMLRTCGVIITDDHFVYASGKHGDAYVNKDDLYPHIEAVSLFCRSIAEKFVGANVDIVVGPEKGGIILSQWVAYHLGKLEEREIPGGYAEKEEIAVMSNTGIMNILRVLVSCGIKDAYTELRRGEQLVKKTGGFIFKRGYDKRIAGKNVLVVEDILNTCKTVNAVVDAVKANKGFVVGIGALCDRSDPATRRQIHLSPRTVALTRIPLPAWDADACPLCAKGIPVRTDLGKGAEFLATQKSA